ncbi:unnamed protein product [Peniophora sp. CBMAI 1063]|nr:unnamed protein product [Peniophora sp. CBMAI 1063]
MHGTTPVTVDRTFWYDGCDMYVEQGAKRTRYPRIDSRKLYDLLTRSHSSKKDETGAFYIAQMAHYGIAPVTTKRAAKKKLMEAFGDGKALRVPKRLLGLEEDLKEEWEKQRDEAEGELRKEQEEVERMLLKRGTSYDSDTDGPATKRARTAQQADVHTLIELQPSDFACQYTIIALSLADEWPGYCDRRLSLTLSPSQRTNDHFWGSFQFGIVSGIIYCKTPTAIGEIARFRWRGHEQGKTKMYEDGGTLIFIGDGRLCGTLQCQLFSEKCAFTGKQYDTETRGPVSADELARWKKEYMRTNDTSIGMKGKKNKDIEPRESSSSGVRAERQQARRHAGPAKPSEFQSSDFTGRYTIDAPSLADDWPRECRRKLSLTLCPSKITGNHLWGRFDFGILKGIIRGKRDRSSTNGHVEVEYRWRAHEQRGGGTYDGEGSLTFLGDGELCGTLDCEFFSVICWFTGKHDRSAAGRRAVSEKELAEWKQEYRSIKRRPSGLGGRYRLSGGLGVGNLEDGSSDSSSAEEN